MGQKISALSDLGATPASGDQLVVNDISEALDADKTKRVAYQKLVPTSETPAANKIPIADGSGKISQNWITDSKPLWISASALKPRKTNGCGELAQLEMPTNKVVYDYVPFVWNSLTSAYVNVPMPYDYDSGILTARFYWFHPTTTVNYNVFWALSAVALGTGDGLDVATGTNAYKPASGGSENTLYITDESGELTISNSPAPLKIVQFNILRISPFPTDSRDTMEVEARLHGVLLKYGVQ